MLAKPGRARKLSEGSFIYAILMQARCRAFFFSGSWAGLHQNSKGWGDESYGREAAYDCARDHEGTQSRMSVRACSLFVLGQSFQVEITVMEDVGLKRPTRPNPSARGLEVSTLTNPGPRDEVVTILVRI